MRVSKSERLLLRERLLCYMDRHPLPTPISAVESAREFFHALRALAAALLRPSLKWGGYAAALLLLLSGATGVSYLAEGAVPGDALYPIKVRVNEELLGVLAFDDESRAAWEMRRVERRLQEATTLAYRQRLSPEVNKEVVRQIEAQVARAAEATDALAKTDPVEAADTSSQLESVLEAHEAVLVSLAVEQDGQVQEVQELAGALRKGTKAAAEVREGVERSLIALLKVEEENDTREGGTTTRALADKTEAERQQIALRMKVRAQEALRTAENRITRKQFTDRKYDTAPAEARLAQARARYEAGSRAYAEDRFADSFRAYQEAIALAEELLVFLGAQEQYQVDPLIAAPDNSWSGDGVEGVPVSATSSSATSSAEANASEKEVSALLERLAAHISARTQETATTTQEQDAEFFSYLHAAYKRARALAIRARVALESGDAAEAESFFSAARVIARDALARVEVAEDGTDAAPISSDPLAATSTPPRLTDTRLALVREWSEGVHTFRGWVTVNLSCAKPVATVEKGENGNYTLILKAIQEEEASTCTEEPRRVPFTVSFEAGEAARVTRVLLEGREVPYTITLAARAPKGLQEVAGPSGE